MYKTLKISKFIKIESTMVVARGEGEGGNGALCLLGRVWNDRKVLEMNDDDGYTTM